MSPLGRTAMCRARPTLSATTIAQKPVGRLIPPLPASQARLAAGGLLRLEEVESESAATGVSTGVRSVHVTVTMERRIAQVIRVRPKGEGWGIGAAVSLA